jgi:sarcosine oxidase/L-pipecolate oxidase
MFPIIGRYISDALEGRSNGLKKEWAFGERKAKPASHRPDTEVKDLEDALNLAPKSHL